MTFHEKISSWIHFLKNHADSWWYGPTIAILAAIDNLILIVPTDGLLISGVLLAPRRWFTMGVIVGVGSSLGALALALLVQHLGLPFLLTYMPHLMESDVWHWCDQFMGTYGLWVVFAVAVTPVIQPPAIILAVLGHLPISSIFLVVLVARLIKYLTFGWIASHTPRLIKKIWGISKDLEALED